MSTVVRKITNKTELDEIFTIERITTSIIMKYFGDFGNGSRYNTYDELEIPVGMYGKGKLKNKNKFTTTIGTWFLNRFLFEDKLYELLGYINEPFTGKKLEEINKKVSYYLIEDKITTNDLKRLLMGEKMMMRFVSILNPNSSEKLLLIPSIIRDKKNELIKNNKEALLSGDEKVSSKIEKELINMAVNELGEDEVLDNFLSGSKTSLNNNFKNMYIMKGAIKNPDPNKGFDITTSSFLGGIEKEDYVAMGNSMVSGGYAKAINTAKGGYMTKEYIRAFNHVRLLPKDSDCGSKGYIEVDINEKNIDEYMYMYSIEKGNELVCITTDNMNEYIGRKGVKLRFSNFCTSEEGICNKCMGDLFYRIGIMNVGMLSVGVTNKLMTGMMKLFHDSTVKLNKINPDEFFDL